jgi:hypothetical protein
VSEGFNIEGTLGGTIEIAFDDRHRVCIFVGVGYWARGQKKNHPKANQNAYRTTVSNGVLQI